MLEREIPIGRVLLRLCDTAGLRETKDPVEQIGISRARARLSGAGLILCIFDGSKPLDDEDKQLLALIQTYPAPKIALLNKSDLGEAPFPNEAAVGFSHVLRVSAKTGDGFEELQQTVEDLFLGGAIYADDGAIVTARANFPRCPARLSGFEMRLRPAGAEMGPILPPAISNEPRRCWEKATAAA